MSTVHTASVGMGLSRLGRFELLRPVATGGMARIFLAADTARPNAAPVVIKLIHEHYATEETFVRMFVDEANIAMSMRHPNVARVMELHQVDGRLFMVLEHVDGTDLARLLSYLRNTGGQLDPEVAAYITHGVLMGLHHAHHAVDQDGRPLGVIHRDVSPSNVLLGLDGSVKVADFGVAKALGRLTHSMPGELKGKYCYMPPEMVLNGTCDQRGDLFGAGVVLWEALIGRRLFDGANEIQAMGSVLKQAIVPPQALQARVGDVLGMLCLRALDRRPERRFQTAAEMAQALAGYLGNIPHAALAGCLAQAVRKSVDAAAEKQSKAINPLLLLSQTRRVVTPVSLVDAAPQPHAPGYVSLLHPNGALELPAAPHAQRLVPPVVVHEQSEAVTPRMRPLSPDELAVAFGTGPISVPGGALSRQGNHPNALLIQILGAHGLAVSGTVTSSEFWRLIRRPALPTDLRLSLLGHAPTTLEALGPLLAVDHLVTFVPPLATLALRGSGDAARLATLCGSLDARNATAALVLEHPGDGATVTIYVRGGFVHHVSAPREMPLLEHLIKHGHVTHRGLDGLFHLIMARRLPLMDALHTSGLMGPAALRQVMDDLHATRLTALLNALPLEFRLHLDVECPIPLPQGGLRIGALMAGASNTPRSSRVSARA